MYKNCPCCGSTEKRNTNVSGVFKCSCGAIYGECNKAEADQFVGSKWYKGQCEAPEYVDLIIDGSRFHGWVEPATKKIVQVG